MLDECHHLASLWGYLVRVLMASLGADVHVIGLTATSPTELPPDEAELYAELLGPVDFEIPTPAVVRDGNLAPYQELALFTTPLQSERVVAERAPRALRRAAWTACTSRRPRARRTWRSGRG